MIAAPLGVLWFGAILLAFADGTRRGVGWTACAVLAAALLLCGRLASAVAAQGAVVTTAGGWPAGVGITLRADALGVTFAVLSLSVLLASSLVEVASRGTPRRFPGLILFMGTGLTGLCLTGDAFNLYVFFELAMTAAFALSAHGDSPREVRAALLFVTMNLFGSLLFLAAVAGLYRLTGTLEFEGIAAALVSEPGPGAAGVGALLLAAFSLKLGLFPFHVWVPEVYRDLRPAVSAVFAGALANIGTYGVLRFGGMLLARELDAAAPVVLALGGASVLYGGLAAAGARDRGSVLAYSAIGQVGYVLAAATLGPVGLAAALVYAVVNSLNKTLLFLAAGLRGPIVAFAFGAGAFSLAGVPPLAGFTAKAAVFRSAIAAESWTALVVLAAGSALTFLYIFPAMQKPPSHELPFAPATAGLVLGALVVVVAIGGVWPGPLLTLAASAAPGGLR